MAALCLYTSPPSSGPKRRVPLAEVVASELLMVMAMAVVGMVVVLDSGVVLDAGVAMAVEPRMVAATPSMTT